MYFLHLLHAGMPTSWRNAEAEQEIWKLQISLSMIVIGRNLHLCFLLFFRRGNGEGSERLLQVYPDWQNIDTE